jgi:hypothetical protein
MKHLPAIEAWVIAHRDQKYDTAGDYWESDEGHNGTWAIRLSELPDWRMEFLVLIHELIEMGLTKHRGISWDEITAFDTVGDGKDSDDPGRITTAPYHKEHMFSENIEKILAEELEVDWIDYNRALDSLEY